MVERFEVLLLSSDEAEADALRETLENEGFLVRAANLAEMRPSLEKTRYDAVFCAWSFYDAHCQGALKELRERYPNLPVIVMSRAKSQSE